MLIWYSKGNAMGVYGKNMEGFLNKKVAIPKILFRKLNG